MNNKGTESGLTDSVFVNNKEKILAAAVAIAVAVARGCQNASQSAVLVKAEEKGDDNGKPATAEHVRAEDTVLRSKDKQCDENPKG